MRILFRYLKPQRGLIALALLLAAASQVLALVDPIIFGWIIDDYAMWRQQIGERVEDEAKRYPWETVSEGPT